MEFYSERIRVVAEGSPRKPVSFVWRGTRYEVSEVISQWQDWGFSAGAPSKNWKSRRHRTCFRLATTDGSEFEIYNDRGVKLGEGEWYLLTRLK